MATKHSGFKLLGPAIHKDIATLPNDDLTPDVSGGNIFLTATGHGAAKDITMLDGGTNGQVVIIIGAANANATTIKDQGNMLINTDWVENTERTLTLIFNGTNWYELCRR